MLNKFNLANTVLVGMAQAVSVKAERCNRMCHKNAKCNLCETNCPANAIKVGPVGTKINIQWDICTYCGICINICPTGVYSVREMSHSAFLNIYLKELTSDGILRLSCKKYKTDASLLECLGILGLSELLYFYTHGADTIELIFPDCADCENKFGRDIINDEIVELEGLASCFEYLIGTVIESSEKRIILRFPHSFERSAQTSERKQTAESVAVSRREVFSLVRNNIKDRALRSAVLLTPQEIPSKTPFRSEKELPAKRRIFIQALNCLGRLRKNMVPVGAYFFNQSIDASICNMCKICVRFCHSGALHTKDELKTVMFTPAYCTSCGLCLISCYQKAIKKEKELDLRLFFEDIEKVKPE
jgi:Pyruvate/2-oxoacid:ferredoxin oxidoreductase delta subunit